MTNKFIISGMDKSIVIWNRANKEKVQIFKDCHQGSEKKKIYNKSDVIKLLKVTPNERYLVSASKDDSLKVFDLDNFTEHHSFDFKWPSGKLEFPV